MPKRKKVMYLITKNTDGRGGHYYSLKTTAESLNGTIEPFIVTVSKVDAQVKEELGVPNTLIYFNGWNFFQVLAELLRVVKKNNPDVIHAFDSGVLMFGRIISYLYKIPLLYTKCGGANPSGFYPYSKNIILYSHENLNFFKSESKLKNSNLYLIPNRVGKIKSDEHRISLITNKIDRTRKTFLRIARFGPAYKTSIIQAIDLVSYLNHKGIESQLILIGIIQDIVVYNEIIDYIANENNVHVFTEDKFTANASEMIDVADCVIGTGRSLMEAASKNKILFTPVQNSKYPILINEDNFLDFFNTNFSPRNQLSEDLVIKNQENIDLLFSSSKYFSEAQKFSNMIFKQHFSIDMRKEEYSNIYLTITYDKKIKIIDFTEHFLRTIIGFFRGNK